MAYLGLAAIDEALGLLERVRLLIGRVKLNNPEHRTTDHDQDQHHAKGDGDAVGEVARFGWRLFDGASLFERRLPCLGRRLGAPGIVEGFRSEEHTSELQSPYV